VFVNGKLIGGSSEVLQGLEDGTLITALEAAGVMATAERE
jgi:glutaredoxin-related protein